MAKIPKLGKKDKNHAEVCPECSGDFEAKEGREFNDNNITSFIHCSLCIKEGIPKDESPRTWARFDIGWTKQGLQIWCVRHESNILHIDFQGKKHPADWSRIPTPEIDGI